MPGVRLIRRRERQSFFAPKIPIKIKHFISLKSLNPPYQELYSLFGSIQSPKSESLQSRFCHLTLPKNQIHKVSVSLSHLRDDISLRSSRTICLPHSLRK